MPETLNISTPLTAQHGFTDGIEGPACDAEGNIYAVNYARQGTIGKVTPNGECSVFVELPIIDGVQSIGNGIRFNRAGDMLIADYTNHNILRVDMKSRAITIYAHEASANQPNDLCITDDDVIFCSDPNWGRSNGQLWRVGLDGKFVLLESNMGTTNGIEISPDGKTLYVNESMQRNIWAYDFSASGELSNKRLLIQFPDFIMDGMRCDLAGNLYVTRYGKGVVAKVSPQGEVLLEVATHGLRISNLTFGGADGKTAYVTDIRGGHAYPSLIRKGSLRPLRVFLQDGEADLDNDNGNWWLANLQMVAALRYRGYDHKFVGGSGAHNGEHGGAILPDSLRWLWRTEE